MSEIEERGARVFEPLRIGNELLGHLSSEVVRRIRHPTVPACRVWRDAELRPHRDPRRNDGTNGIEMVGRCVELHHVRSSILDQPRRSAHRSFHALLHRTVWEITADKSALDAPPDSLAGKQHLVERDLQLAPLPPHVDADRITNGDDVDPCPIDDLRHLIVVHDDADDLAPVALHLLKRRHPYLPLHA